VPSERESGTTHRKGDGRRSRQVDWHKVEMNNWNQYTTEVDSVKVKLNDGARPTIEFLPAASNYIQIATK
jgi:hypothetical protein